MTKLWPRLSESLQLSKYQPWPGCMEICIDCRHRDGVRCAHPDAKANGGTGVLLTIEPPIHARVQRVVNRRRVCSPIIVWPSVATACKQKEVSGGE